MSFDGVDIAYVFFASLSMLSGLLLVGLFWRVRELQKGPGQLILGQCISQIVLDVHWMTYNKVWLGLEYRPGCKILGFIGLAAFVVAFNYAIAVCIATYQHFYEPFFDRSTHKRYHLVCISTGIIAGTVVAAVGQTGSSVMHTCFIRDGVNAEIVLLLILVLYTSIGLIITIVFVIKFRDSQRFSLNSPLIVLIFAGAWVGPSVVHFMNFPAISVTHLSWFKDFASISGAMSGFLTVAARFSHRPIWEGIMDLFRKSQISTSMEFL